MTHRKLANRTALLTVLAILAGTVPFAAGAQQPESAADSKFAPVKAPTLTPDMLKMPSDTLNAGSPAPALGSTGKPLPAPKLPTDVSLGKYDLKFMAGQTRDVDPRTGFDSGELSNMERIRPGKSESVAPNYFGLKLSTPTH